MSRAHAPIALVVLLALGAGACSGPILANAPAPRPAVAAHTLAPASPAGPQAIVLPRDDGPHARLTEWWYYTGHLAAADGRTFGFEDVIFRAERGGFPVSWASHLAITDETGGRFAYSQRAETGGQVDRSPRDPSGVPTGFALSLSGDDLARPATATRPAWTMAGAGGTDSLAATLSPEEAAAAGVPGGLGLALRLEPGKPAALHGDGGWVDFGPAGGSAYYSRTRMPAVGTLTFDGTTLQVTGTAWFDHQWGDFIAVGGGGWDWFAANLDDGTDLTLSLVRAPDGAYPLVYGTLVGPDGVARHVAAAEIAVGQAGTWTSPGTGAAYPSGWHVQVASAGRTLALDLAPTVAGQELDTRATTGVVYWEGSVRIRGTADGAPVTGRGYVELTGYAHAPASPPPATAPPRPATAPPPAP